LLKLIFYSFVNVPQYQNDYIEEKFDVSIISLSLTSLMERAEKVIFFSKLQLIFLETCGATINNSILLLPINNFSKLFIQGANSFTEGA